MTLHQLRVYIQNGNHPKDLPGACMFRESRNDTPDYGKGVYCVDGFIVKPKTMRDSDKSHHQVLAELGIRVSRQITVGPWLIQPVYRSIEPMEWKNFQRKKGISGHVMYQGVDLHQGNIGKDNRGRLVAFDW